MIVMNNAGGGWEANVNRILATAQQFANEQSGATSVEPGLHLDTYNVLINWRSAGLDRYIDIAIPIEEPPSYISVAGIAMHPERFRNEGLFKGYRLPGADELRTLLQQAFASVEAWSEEDLTEAW